MKTKTTIITLAALATCITAQAGDKVIPTGKVSFAVPSNIFDKDMGDFFPQLNWSISKSASQTQQPNNPKTEDVSAAESESSSEDAANNGLAKSNNGHGNNLDGIDVSNPGKSAEKWAESGMYDTDYGNNGIIEDDEATGGGAAPSDPTE